MIIRKIFILLFAMFSSLLTFAQENSDGKLVDMSHKNIESIDLDFSIPSIKTFPTNIKLPDTLSYKYRNVKINTNSWKQSLQNYKPLTHDPYAYDYNNNGNLLKFKGLTVYGQGYRETLPGLLSIQSASVSLNYNFGNFTLNTSFVGNRYYVDRINTQFGVGANLTYKFNDNLSATIFGNFYNFSPYYSMAALPYISSSSYGGFFTIENSSLGIDLGVQRRYDPYSRGWELAPIVTPKFKMQKITIELPVGDLIKSMLEDAVIKNRYERGGGTIMPEGFRHPIPIR